MPLSCGGLVLVAALFATLFATQTASADDCRPAGGFSPCIDADTFWLAPGRTPFLSLDAGTPLPPLTLSIGLATSFAYQPVLIKVASPDPDGRTVRVVDDALTSTLAGALGLGHNAEVHLAIPVTLRQTGAGVEGLTSQNGPELPKTVLRDPRLGGSLALLSPSERAPWLLKLRLVLGLPLGNERALAGDRSFVLAPSALGGLHLGRFFAATELGARLRQTTELSGTHVGSQLFLSLGAGFSILRDHYLDVLSEAWMLPTLASQDHSLPNGGQSEGRLIPAEWLFSVRSQPFRSQPLAFQLGGGTGIPLSSEKRTMPDGASNTDHFAGVTTAEFRVVFVVRYEYSAQQVNQ